MTARATRDTVRVQPFGASVPLDFDAWVTAPERDRLYDGLVPETMEHRWVVFHEAPHVFFHRSRTSPHG